MITLHIFNRWYLRSSKQFASNQKRTIKFCRLYRTQIRQRPQPKERDYFSRFRSGLCACWYRLPLTWRFCWSDFHSPDIGFCNLFTTALCFGGISKPVPLIHVYFAITSNLPVCYWTFRDHGKILIAHCSSKKVKVRYSGCKHTLFRPFLIVGPLQFLITIDWTLLRDITWRTTHTQNPSHFRLCRAPGAKAANTIFKVFSMTRLGIKPQSTGYQVDARNRYTKRQALRGYKIKSSGATAIINWPIPVVQLDFLRFHYSHFLCFLKLLRLPVIRKLIKLWRVKSYF